MPTMRAVTPALSFGVYADLAYNLYSATNSSPQTTELFAGEREVTLWKYVVIGHVQALALGVFGSILDRSPWPLFGTVTIGGVMHCMYKHAVKAGKKQARPTVNAAPVNGTSGTASPGGVPLRRRSP